MCLLEMQKWLWGQAKVMVLISNVKVEVCGEPTPNWDDLGYLGRGQAIAMKDPSLTGIRW